ncbi:hypothetical protein D3C76_1741260 [compost metagenome]
MAGFGRMHEKGCGAGTRQGRGNLVADVPRFTHAEHDDAAFAGQNHFAGTHKIRVDTGQQAFDGFQFEADGALC